VPVNGDAAGVTDGVADGVTVAVTEGVTDALVLTLAEKLTEGVELGSIGFIIQTTTFGIFGYVCPLQLEPPLIHLMPASPKQSNVLCPINKRSQPS